MQITVSAIKADIGGIGGHTRPSDELFEVVKNYINGKAKGLLIDYYIRYTGDDIHIIMTHTLGTDTQRIHVGCRKSIDNEKSGIYPPGQTDS